MKATKRQDIEFNNDNFTFSEEEEQQLQKMISQNSKQKIAPKSMEPKFISSLNSSRLVVSSPTPTIQLQAGNEVILKRRQKRKSDESPSMIYMDQRKFQDIKEICMKKTKAYLRLKERSKKNGRRSFTSLNQLGLQSKILSEQLQRMRKNKGKAIKINDTMDFREIQEKLHGYGRLKFKSGKAFEGMWQNGNLGPFGKIYYENGDLYEGDLQNFKKHGIGILTLADGRKYSGEFVDGHIEGWGNFYDALGNLITKGYWSKGILQKSHLDSDSVQEPQDSDILS